MHDAVWQGIGAGTGPLTLVVCDLATSPMVDLAGARMLAFFEGFLQFFDRHGQELLQFWGTSVDTRKFWVSAGC